MWAHFFFTGPPNTKAKNESVLILNCTLFRKKNSYQSKNKIHVVVRPWELKCLPVIYFQNLCTTRESILKKTFLWYCKNVKYFCTNNNAWKSLWSQVRNAADHVKYNECFLTIQMFIQKTIIIPSNPLIIKSKKLFRKLFCKTLFSSKQTH